MPKNELQQALGLTDLQFEILQDRLQQSDIIAEVFADTEDLDHFNPDKVIKVADLLANGELQQARYISVQLTREVLHEAVDGSCYFASAEDNMSIQKYAAHCRAGRACAIIISSYIHKVCDFSYE